MSDPLYLDVLLPGGGKSRIDRRHPDWSIWLSLYAAGNHAASLPEIAVAHTQIVPSSISDRQMAQIMAVEGIITESEALAWVSSGTVPAAMDALVESLPEGEQFAARMLLAGATVFERNHPLVDVLGAAHGMSSEDMDELFREAAVL
jgi:hypothetical protein